MADIAKSPGDEVAEDYKNSLEDLAINSRYEISNLTVIAKENTEHAAAISRVLENHIKTVSASRNTTQSTSMAGGQRNLAPPGRKLPALYVLDSIVKNVGTPYTLFLGRNLYNTFMSAYTLVDSGIRKKLDEMLKTWKEPVPGSLDTRPVFPSEVTRSIENALIKARTAAFQEQQKHTKVVPGLPPRPPPVATPQGWRNTPTPPQPLPQYQPPQSVPPNLPPSTQAQYPVNGYFSTFNTAYTHTPPPQLPQSAPPATLPTPLPSTSLPFPLPISQPPTQYPVASSSQQQPSVLGLDTNSLLASLRAAGILGGSTPAPQVQIPELPKVNQTPTPIVSTSQSTFSIPALAFLSQQNQHKPETPVLQQDSSESPKIPFSTSFMKTQCSTCGRRFPVTKEGKERKSKHLDWHFRTNQRLNEGAGKAKNRSWYVDEMTWIRTTEEDDIEATASTSHQAYTSSTAHNAHAPISISTTTENTEWIKAPSDPRLQATPCPICQEKFENVWSDKEQDWVWMDARKVGEKVYHASCYAEVMGGKGNGGGGNSMGTTTGGGARRSGTPNSVLGKRKHEGDTE
ncbi:MAG: hypothetical protein M1834_001942 [Cirrosporium novae-zelandiae]|nr:MAG: hypothetical protein M1834_001942 [Cirrosporium novae-zelandiae]